MNATYWSGDDDRDTLDPGSDACPDCGCGPDEMCDPDCGCEYCRGMRARQAALLALDVVPEEA
jgi:hypothetical protein